MAAVEELMALLAEKRGEADGLRDQIRQTRLEAQSRRLQLQAVGVTDATLVPKEMKVGTFGPSLQHHEFRSLMEWLVDSVDLTKQVMFECGGEEVSVGGRNVSLKRMITWPVGSSSAASGMQLSAPLELEPEIAGLVHTSRAQGRLGDQELQRMVDMWEMVGTEMASASSGRQEPAIFLVHAKLAQAMIIAKWPPMDAAPSRTFDAALHFGRLATAPAPATGPQPARKAVAATQPVAPPSPAGVVPVSCGDRVLVEYAGRWFSGILSDVDHETRIAKVKCDVDMPGVITVAPLTSVLPIRVVPNPAVSKLSEPAKPASRHMRSRTVG